VQRRRVVYLSGVAADVELTGAVRAAHRGAAQPELARPMQAYMKSATPFLGVRVPMMRTLTRAEAKLRPFTTSADLIDTVLRLWRKAGYRAERYAAIALLDTRGAAAPGSSRPPDAAGTDRHRRVVGLCGRANTPGR
jgi:DNA alkylation repair enzyme